jgi:predicted nucleic acid-binding protein
MINLFIDTNVFLSFYHLTSEDLEELKKLAALIESKEILLFLPTQVTNEFTRNRAAKIADAMRKLQDAKFTLSFPLFAKDYKEYDELRDLMKKADTVHAVLLKKIMDDADCEELNADKIVSALFSKAKNIATDDELYLKALERVRLGNPPGKEGSMGDAVSWESLLSEVPDGENIYIVSGDRDFRSQLFDGEVNEYLDKEWSEKKGSNLLFHSKISDFFKINFPNIKIASEVERDLLIQKLAKSTSFASTHAHIAQLLAQPEFSSTQVEQLVEIAKSNHQVGWIVSDKDVHAFYSSLLEKYGKTIQQDAAAKLADMVFEGTPASPNAEEISF